MSYTKRAAELDEVVRGELEKIAKITAWSHGLYDGCTTGAGFSKPEQYLLMLNALAHASSSAMKSAIASRTLQPVCDLVHAPHVPHAPPAPALNANVTTNTTARKSGQGGGRGGGGGGRPPKLTALAIVLETDGKGGQGLYANVQRTRRANDRNEKRWPPHITISYPFVPLAEFDDAADKLQAAFEKEAVKAFEVDYSGVGDFDHGSHSFTAFARPESAAAECPLQAVWRVARALYPESGDQRDVSVPHLSLGQFR